MRTWYTKYVRREEVGAYEQLGWRIDADALRGTTHAEWSVLGIWDGPGEPALPVLRRASEEHKALP